MSAPSQLPYLIKLLDDESPVVREAVLRELESIGPALSSEIANLQFELTPEQRAVVHHAYALARRRQILERWDSLTAVDDDKVLLERAMSMLSVFQLGEDYPLVLSAQLDALAKGFQKRRSSHDARALATYLFGKGKLEGIGDREYYDPRNSNLTHVIEYKRGIPLSLACIYILVAHRLGLVVEGCNFPGHFLTIAEIDDHRVIVDCFNGGRLLRQSDLTTINSKISMTDILRLECPASAIIARALRNLVTAYQKIDDTESAGVMALLLGRIEESGDDQAV